MTQQEVAQIKGASVRRLKTLVLGKSRKVAPMDKRGEYFFFVQPLDGTGLPSSVKQGAANGTKKISSMNNRKSLQ